MNQTPLIPEIKCDVTVWFLQHCCGRRSTDSKRRRRNPPVSSSSWAVTRASIFHAFVRIYIDLHALQPIEAGTMLAVSKLFHTSARANASIFQTFPRISRLVNLTTFQRSTTGHSERAIFPLWHTSLSWTWPISTRCRGRAWCRPGAIKFEACSTCMRLF